MRGWGLIRKRIASKAAHGQARVRVLEVKTPGFKPCQVLFHAYILCNAEKKLVN
jgi:hypothetical protein